MPIKFHLLFGNPPEGLDVLWRCDAKRYSYVIDAEAERYGTTAPHLQMSWWPIKHRTPKGARLKTGTFVLLTATKCWACNTQEEALESFRARKRRQISILGARLAAAEEELKLATEQDMLRLP